MSKRFRIPSVLALALGSAILAVAGTFWISVQPSTVTDVVAKNAVVLVRAGGCHNPAEASARFTTWNVRRDTAVASRRRLGAETERDLSGARCRRARAPRARQVPEVIRGTVSTKNHGGRCRVRAEIRRRLTRAAN